MREQHCMCRHHKCASQCLSSQYQGKGISVPNPSFKKVPCIITEPPASIQAFTDLSCAPHMQWRICKGWIVWHYHFFDSSGDMSVRFAQLKSKKCIHPCNERLMHCEQTKIPLCVIVDRLLLVTVWSNPSLTAVVTWEIAHLFLDVAWIPRITVITCVLYWFLTLLTNFSSTDLHADVILVTVNVETAQTMNLPSKSLRSFSPALLIHTQN